MSRESKKRTKEWLSKKPDLVLSRDVVVQRSATGLSGVATHTALLEHGSSALSYAAAAGKLDGVAVTCSPAITSGQLDVSLSLNGVVVASGSLTSASPVLLTSFKAEDDSEQVLAAGDVLEAAYAISTALGDNGVTGRQITARILTTYMERS